MGNLIKLVLSSKRCCYTIILFILCIEPSSCEELLWALAPMRVAKSLKEDVADMVRVDLLLLIQLPLL